MTAINVALFAIFVIAADVVPSHAQQLVRTGFQVNTTISSTEIQSDVAMRPDGSFIIVWENTAPAPSTVVAQRYDSDAVPLGPEIQVPSLLIGQAFGPTVATTATGEFVIAWYTIGSNIYARRFAADGTPLGGQFQVNTSTENHSGPRVAMDAAGNFTVVWTSEGSSLPDTSGNGILGRRFASDGTPLDAEFQVNNETQGHQTVEGIAMDADGNFTVIWPDNLHIRQRRFAADGTPLAPQSNVNNDPTAARRPAVASDALGNVVVTWDGFDSGGDDNDLTSIQAQRYAPDGTKVGGEFQVNTTTLSAQRSADVAMAPTGEFTIAWETPISPASDGSSSSILAQRFAADGSTIGTEFQVNSVAIGAQSDASVGMGGAGEFVVAMTSDSSFGSDTSSKSIQAEHFANDLPPCPSTPAPGCIPAERAVVKWNEQAVGREKVKLALRKLVGAVTQGQFGDPVAGTTRYDLCLYDEAGELAGGLSVDRAGDTCAGNPCWAALSTRGYRYKDDPREEGLSKLVAKGGDAGKGKVVARGNNRLGEVSAVPIQVAQALAGTSSATVQLVTSDGGCFEAELGTVKRAEQFSFVAKGP